MKMRSMGVGKQADPLGVNALQITLLKKVARLSATSPEMKTSFHCLSTKINGTPKMKWI